MKLMAIAAITFALSLAAARAESAAPSPDPDMSAAVEPSDGKTSARELVERCRDEAKAQELKGEARWTAVVNCVAQQRPKLAEAMKCHREGKERGLSGEELKAFVKACRKAA